jgi:hypothetical protein
MVISSNLTPDRYMNFADKQQVCLQQYFSGKQRLQTAQQHIGAKGFLILQMPQVENPWRDTETR